MDPKNDQYRIELKRLKAFKIDSRYTLALLCLRSGLVEQRKYIEAESIRRKKIQENPKEIEAYTDLGYILMRQGKFRESATVCKQALVISALLI